MATSPEGSWRNFRKMADHTSETIVEENDLSLDEANQILCVACNLPIFSTPYHQNNEDEDESGHFFHKSCANLSQHLTGHPLHPKPLVLRKTSTRHNPSSSIKCDCCKRECRAFFYQCTQCRFSLDLLCTITIKLVHRSHKHELVPLRKKVNLLTCGACGLEHQGEFYCCDFCHFYLHQDCAVIPNTILHNQHDQHPLCLTYVVPMYSLKFQECPKCSICHDEISSRLRKSGMYFCIRCDYNTHIKCAISDPSQFRSGSSEDAGGGLIHLPMADEHTSLMRCLLENDGIRNDEEKLFREEIHEHELILHDTYRHGDDPSQQFTCNACIQPISPPFYNCLLCKDFYLHNSCAHLPLYIHQHAAHKSYSADINCPDEPLALLPRLSTAFFSLFTCYFCGQLCNGFAYMCNKCGLILDVRCAHLPKIVTYKGHGKSHILFLCNSFKHFENRDMCPCGEVIFYYYYECCTCPNLRLHAKCALLPSTVSHKLDRHLLELTTSSKSPMSEDDDDKEFCEICEVGINKVMKAGVLDRHLVRRWFYHCKECATLFHIRCIPCVNEDSLIKFGGTIDVKCHKSQLSSFLQLTGYSFTCGHCKRIIPGRQRGVKTSILGHRRGIAFECTQCHYCLCYFCAGKEWKGDS